MAWVEMNLKGRLVPIPTPCVRNATQLDQVASSPIQPGLKHCQGWGIHNLSGQLVPHHPLSKELLTPNPNLSSFSLK